MALRPVTQRLIKTADYTDMSPLFEAARIPRRSWKTTLTDINCPVVHEYVFTGALDKDLDNAVGVELVGSAQQRVTAFPVLARSAILKHAGVLYVSVNQIAWAMTESEELHQNVSQVPVLFLHGVQDPELPLTITPGERSAIEHMLRQRSDARKINCYSLPKTMRQCDQWSAEFREGEALNLRSLSV